MNRKITFIALAILIICMFSGSCNRQTDLQKIEKYYYSNKPDGDFSRFKKIAVINELGTCINCNNAFSRKMSLYVDNQEILFIVSSTGGMLNILPYMDKVQDNLIWDYKQSFDDLEIVQSSVLINLENGYELTEISIQNVQDIEIE